MTALGKVKKTERGFEFICFKDIYEQKCSLQASSLAVYQKAGTFAVWLGVQDAKPKILASQASMLGIRTEETSGWVPYPIPAEVSLNTRMHLNRKQVVALITHLQNWLTYDTFKSRRKP